MTYGTLTKIFSIVNNIMNYKFTILGVTCTLYSLLLFALLIEVVIYIIYRLYEVN